MKTFLLLLMGFITHSAYCSYAGWIQKANFPNVARHRAASFAIGNKGYVGIGHANGTGTNIVYNDWWEFDPATNSWTQKADYPIGNYGVSTFVIGNKGYMGGGNVGGWGGGNFYEYKPVTNKWAPIPNPPTLPDDETAFVINDKAYVLDDLNLYEFDPSNNSWTTKNPLPANGWQTSSFVINGKGYLKVNNNFYEYKPLTDTWTPRAFFPGQATSGSGAFALNNKGYIVCGYSGSLSQVVAEVWEYDPSTNSWIQKPDFPATSRRFCTSFSIGNKGYFGLGTNGTNFSDFWEYNPEIEFLSVNDNQALNLLPYPNPSTQLITFDFSNISTTDDLQFKVYNSLGQQVYQASVNSQNLILNKADFKSGTFIYVVTSSTQLTAKGTFIFN